MDDAFQCDFVAAGFDRNGAGVEDSVTLECGLDFSRDLFRRETWLDLNLVRDPLDSGEMTHGFCSSLFLMCRASLDALEALREDLTELLERTKAQYARSA